MKIDRYGRLHLMDSEKLLLIGDGSIKRSSLVASTFVSKLAFRLKADFEDRRRARLFRKNGIV